MRAEGHHGDLVVRSRFGDYAVESGADDARLGEIFAQAKVALVDERVAELHGGAPAFGRLRKVVLQRADERLKSAETALRVCDELVHAGFTRGDSLVAVGGGIVQDIATFAASILFRGVAWTFVPTTLLAQADSCIGGKSSLNMGSHKNLLGNFYPPTRVVLAPHFLTTLDERDIRSGFGEILKVHFISGPEMVERIEADVSRVGEASACDAAIVRRALELKAKLIEVDELDRGPRLCMNYGHTFGHAIEAATDFGVPHGLAVTYGAKLANQLACSLGLVARGEVARLGRLLDANLRRSDWRPIDVDAFFRALKKDKKNSATEYRFVLLRGLGRAEIVSVPKSEATDATIRDALAELEPDAPQSA